MRTPWLLQCPLLSHTVTQSYESRGKTSLISFHSAAQETRVETSVNSRPLLQPPMFNVPENTAEEPGQAAAPGSPPPSALPFSHIRPTVSKWAPSPAAQTQTPINYAHRSHF